jgi:hypothetical protein
MASMDADSRPLWAIVILWLLFVAICAGLGYPTLRRYDPRNIRTAFDPANALYHWQVTDAANEGPYPPSLLQYRYRLLVSSVARPIYLLAEDRVGRWNAGYFALLVANSMFCASTAVLLFLIAREIDPALALPSPLLYLLSFAIPNYHMAGLVDSGEAFALIALVWCLQRERWFALPLLGVVGALAKETFVPFSVAFVAGWIAAGRNELQSLTLSRRLQWLALLALAGAATITVVFSVANGSLVWPWQLARSGRVQEFDLVQRVVQISSELGILYLFGWLAPLGALSLVRCPRPWIAGVCAGAAVAFLLGIYNGDLSIARALFNIAGPLLSLASAMTLTRMFSTSPSLR